MRQLNFTKVLLIGLLSCGLMACEAEQTEKDIVAEAQFCLNKARGPAAVDSCVAPLAGLTSFYAYELKCAAGFVKADVTSPENLSKALTAISDSSSSPTVMLAALAFPSEADIFTTFSHCNNSGRPGLKLIAAMSKSATTLNTLAGASGGTDCEGDLTCMGTKILDTMDDIRKALAPELGETSPLDPTAALEKVETIVESIQTVYQSTCTGTFNANADICNQINSAASQAGVPDFMTSDPDEIRDLGLKLLEQWKKK